MTRFPRAKGKEIVRALEKAGFFVDRTRGSHVFLKNPDGRATVVPVHSGETIGPGLLRAILRDVELPVEEFLKLLQG
jgi:predicted RNA binding protein YcfA (HicA-like mRNA interferase family)